MGLDSDLVPPLHVAMLVEQHNVRIFWLQTAACKGLSCFNVGGGEDLLVKFELCKGPGKEGKQLFFLLI